MMGYVDDPSDFRWIPGALPDSVATTLEIPLNTSKNTSIHYTLHLGHGKDFYLERWMSGMMYDKYSKLY